MQSLHVPTEVPASIINSFFVDDVTRTRMPSYVLATRRGIKEALIPLLYEFQDSGTSHIP